jgi:osmotically-inducible protein OsmY
VVEYAPGGHDVKLTLVCLVAGLSLACVPSEDDIKQNVRAQLASDPTTASLGLSVSVENRVVYVSGRTNTKAEQEKALELARAVDYVKLAVNDMWLNNAALANKVRVAITADPTVGKIPLDIDANGSTVRLMSDQTNADERARLVAIASAVEGVKEVEDRMR